jgi:TRAP-type uncharacterized transport system fused permease subunit
VTLWAVLSAAAGVSALAVWAGGWLRHETVLLERLLAVFCGLLLIYPLRLANVSGLALFGLVVLHHLWRTRREKGLSPMGL